jgi:hypothetical protein
MQLLRTPLLSQNPMENFAGVFMFYRWIGFFAGSSRDESEDAGERGHRLRSQTADITDEYLVDEDAVIFSDEMLEMAWESEEDKRVKRQEEKRKEER